MRKSLILLGLIFAIFFSVNNFAYSNDLEKIKTISEIGTLTNSEQYQDALDKCNAAMIKYPDDAEIYYWSATIKSSMGDKQAALIDYDKAVELNPNESSAYVMRGICKSDLGDNDGAIEDYNQAIQINPKDSSAYAMRACAKLDKGDLQGANQDLNETHRLFDEEENSKEKE